MTELEAFAKRLQGGRELLAEEAQRPQHCYLREGRVGNLLLCTLHGSMEKLRCLAATTELIRGLVWTAQDRSGSDSALMQLPAAEGSRPQCYNLRQDGYNLYGCSETMKDLATPV